MQNDIKLTEGGKHIHFIGIGGSGMYPLVQILHGKGFEISGSDNNETDTVQAVRDMGIKVYIGQKAENIEGADIIVYTSAVMDDNPELKAARESGLPLFERADLLGVITSWFENAICVSGTHGKTTVTSMSAQILKTADVDFSAYIGGKLPSIGGGGLCGNGETMVCESCEFRDHFLKLYPDVSIILNIDDDHMDYFGTIGNAIASFRKFAEKTTKCVIVNADDANAMKAVEGIEGKEIITFGMNENSDYYPTDIKKLPHGTSFVINGKDGLKETIELSVPGTHNILNAIAACIACLRSGADIESAKKGLSVFKGARRRFDIIGVEKGITVVDDYAHHPTEILAVLKAAKDMEYKNVWAVFQPFTYSRTKFLMDDFARVLQTADKVVLTDIMGGREKNTDGVFTRQLAEKIPDCIWFPQDETAEWDDERKYFNFQQVCDYVCENAGEGDAVITLGCGDAYKVGKMILKKLSEE